MHMSARFLAMMFPTFLARVIPASTMPKPACIKNTKMPAMNTQRLSITDLHRFGPAVLGCRGNSPDKHCSGSDQRPYSEFPFHGFRPSFAVFCARATAAPAQSATR